MAYSIHKHLFRSFSRGINVLGATVYFVWQERNSRIFKNNERSVDTLVQNIMDSIKWRIMSFTVKESIAVKNVEAKWNVKFKRA